MKNQMKKIRLVALDMDGTALTSDKQIAQSTRAAVCAARERGVKVVLATGRIVGEAAIFAKEIGADDEMIVAGGAAIGNAETQCNVESYAMSTETGAHALDIVSTLKAYAMTYVDDKLYSTPEIVAAWIAGGGRAEGSAARHVTAPDVARVLRQQNLEPTKIFVTAAEDVLKELTKRLQVVPDIYITYSGDDNIEIMRKGINKGVALRALATRLDIPMEQTMAIGDSGNDSEMLTAAGVAVAMKNGSMQIRAIADYVTDDNDHDGVAKALIHYGCAPVGLRI